MKKFLLSFLKGLVRVTLRIIFFGPVAYSLVLIYIVGLIASCGGDDRIMDWAPKAFGRLMEL